MPIANSFSVARHRRPTPSVVVIGAGVGGLAAAMHLSSAECETVVFDRAATAGGKLRQVSIEGVSIDVGPTVFTMRPVFEQLFEAAGASLDTEVPVERADILARHAWADGSRLDLWADLDRSVEAIAALAGPEEGRRFRAFADRSAQIFRMLDRPFMRQPRPSLPGLVRALMTTGDVFGLSPFETLWRALGRYFTDPRLRQLFGRYATYCGSSPFQCPATLMLVAHVEQQGVWLIEGGMHRLARAMAEVAERRGARVMPDREVSRILVENGKAAGVMLVTGERVEADAVICNADVGALGAGRFGPEAVRAAATPSRRRRSLSAVTGATVTQASGFPLHRHNVFFSRDYRVEFDDLLGRRVPPGDPTVYVCAQDRPRRAGHGGDRNSERLFFIVNAPADGDIRSFSSSEMAQCEARTMRTLERCGLTLSTGFTQLTTPADFERLFPATGGALYGAASHGWRASFQRPGTRSRIPGLYLCGGSTHPGPGLPMAAMSGRMAAASLLEDWASTSPWPRTAIAGGTSTA